LTPKGSNWDLTSLRGTELAINYELDLVEVSPKSEPPVCRIMDYGKFKYQQSKKRMMQKETSCRPCQGSEDEPKTENMISNLNFVILNDF